MIVYPAIDLLGGACVRLYRGDFDEVTLDRVNSKLDPGAVPSRVSP